MGPSLFLISPSNNKKYFERILVPANRFKNQYGRISLHIIFYIFVHNKSVHNYMIGAIASTTNKQYYIGTK